MTLRRWTDRRVATVHAACVRPEGLTGEAALAVEGGLDA